MPRGATPTASKYEYSDQLVLGERRRHAVSCRGHEEGRTPRRAKGWRRRCAAWPSTSPFGADGKITMRAEDQTIVGYAIGWGTTIPTEPYVTDMQAADWGYIFELEAEWKKTKGYT